MKIKNKGKVYPSPSSSSSSSSSSLDRDAFSVLKLLPAAILTLASVLSLEDREVLAYMITRSLKTATTPHSSSPSPAAESSSSKTKKSSSKKPTPNNNNITVSSSSHKKAPAFECDCFDCYTSYWIRWDSSPNGELIHQVIEAFEDHLANGENSSRKSNSRGKRRDRAGRRAGESPVLLDAASSQTQRSAPPTPPPPPPAVPEFIVDEVIVGVVSPDEVVSLETATDGGKHEQAAAEVGEDISKKVVAEDEMEAVVRAHAMVVSNQQEHKGLARKVLPDVIGLLNSRLWSLWGPNV